ncbi:hypothetical protein CHARACLAT_006003 [Characodon lateralis]|uniref:Uncharacterized protein n=1 Tax=Characodon lateralis TaxID=208331 RepID=A0ABU7F3R9_9TELE|nr:hypothetical protein [Characodon lateralis]
MFAVGLITKAAIILISTLKQSRRQRQRGWSVVRFFPLLTFYGTKFLSVQKVKGRWSLESGGACFSQPLCFKFIFCTSSSSSTACPFHAALLTHFSNSVAAVMTAELLCLCSTPRWFCLLMQSLVDFDDLLTPTVAVILLSY